MDRNAIAKVYNVPEWAITHPYPYWICNVIDGKMIFHGAYRRIERAKQAVEDGKWETTPVIVERVEE